jgi:calpain-10
VGDNYFLTVAAALAERGKTIPNMFNQTTYNEEGIFTIRAFVKGRPEDITIDDYFPVYSHQPAFAKPSPDGGWWLPLLEKAFAKVHVNYEMISSGSHSEAARFLTGAPS